MDDIVEACDQFPAERETVEQFGNTVTVILKNTG